jgi:hypothetical protein
MPATGFQATTKPHVARVARMARSYMEHWDRLQERASPRPGGRATLREPGRAFRPPYSLTTLRIGRTVPQLLQLGHCQ